MSSGVKVGFAVEREPVSCFEVSKVEDRDQMRGSSRRGFSCKLLELRLV